MERPHEHQPEHQTAQGHDHPNSQRVLLPTAAFEIRNPSDRLQASRHNSHPRTLALHCGHYSLELAPFAFPAAVRLGLFLFEALA